jgi:hypothetical protein
MSLSTDDRLAILELAGRYSHATDHQDAEALANTFTDDGIFEIDGMEPRRGRAAHIQATNAPRPAGLVMRHFISNPVIEGDGDTATMKVYVEVKNLAAEGKPMLVGCYHDDLRRVNGEWKFAKRRVEVNYRAG